MEPGRTKIPQSVLPKLPCRQELRSATKSTAISCFPPFLQIFNVSVLFWVELLSMHVIRPHAPCRTQDSLIRTPGKGVLFDEFDQVLLGNVGVSHDCFPKALFILFQFLFAVPAPEMGVKNLLHCPRPIALIISCHFLPPLFFFICQRYFNLSYPVQKSIPPIVGLRKSHNPTMLIPFPSDCGTS